MNCSIGYISSMIKKIILLVCCTLAGCVSSPPSKTGLPTLISPNEFTQAYEPLRVDIVGSLSAVSSFSSTLLSGPIVKAAYISKSNTVVGIYDNGAEIAGWEADSSTLAFTYKLNIVTSKALYLTQSGEKLIGATGHNFRPDVRNQSVEYVSGIGVWDVPTGALLKCITEPCQESSEQPSGFLGVVIKDDLSSWATFSEVVLGITHLSGESSGFTMAINPPDAPYNWNIGAVAFDEWNSRFVVIFQEGRIHVSDEVSSMRYRVLAEGEQGDLISIDDAQIDPRGYWLVVARGNKIQILNLDNGTVSLEIEVPNPVLAFDRTGNMLFVGSANKLTVYTVETGEKIAEYDAAGITSLAISEDNRLLIWGDAPGQIHIWAKGR
jgi:hypothetical protein